MAAINSLGPAPRTAPPTESMRVENNTATIDTSKIKKPASTVDASSCIFRVTDCTQVDSVEAKKQFFGSSESENMDCVFAGNISHYIDNDKRPGRCQAVYTFSYSSGQNELSCGSYQKIVCNPLVFGVQKDGSPYCVPAKGHATRDCNDASTAETRKPDFLNQEIDGIKEAWDNFAEGFNRVCRSQVRRAYFCEECNVMMSRLHEMNRLALGINDCGSAKPYDENSSQPEAAAADKPAQATPAAKTK